MSSDDFDNFNEYLASLPHMTYEDATDKAEKTGKTVPHISLETGRYCVAHAPEEDAEEGDDNVSSTYRLHRDNLKAGEDYEDGDVDGVPEQMPEILPDLHNSPSQG